MKCQETVKLNSFFLIHLNGEYNLCTNARHELILNCEVPISSKGNAEARDCTWLAAYTDSAERANVAWL
jgi:hypothetical protein